MEDIQCCGVNQKHFGYYLHSACAFPPHHSTDSNPSAVRTVSLHCTDSNTFLVRMVSTHSTGGISLQYWIRFTVLHRPSSGWVDWLNSTTRITSHINSDSSPCKLSSLLTNLPSNGPNHVPAGMFWIAHAPYVAPGMLDTHSAIPSVTLIFLGRASRISSSSSFSIFILLLLASPFWCFVTKV